MNASDRMVIAYCNLPRTTWYYVQLMDLSQNGIKQSIEFPYTKELSIQFLVSLMIVFLYSSICDTNEICKVDDRDI